MEPKVSIIIPVYNAEKEIKTCIKSVQAQTYKSLEIIAVNDGSEDRSSIILDALARKDKRIIVLNQCNKGPGFSRNRGIAYATGSYVQFVDADDKIHPKMTDALVNGMSAGTDLVICGLMHGKKAVTPHITGSLHKRVWLNEFGKLYKNMIIPSPCNKLYRTDLLHGYDLRFPKGLTFGEDLLFNLNYFNHVEQVTILDTPFYKYRIYGDSLAHGYIDHLYTTYTALYNQMKRFLINHQAYTDTNKQLLMTQYAEAVIQSAANLYHEHAPLDKAEKRAALAAILSDSLLSVNLHYFNGSSQARLFKHFIKKNAIREAACYLSIKSSIEKIPILYPLLSRINRRG